MTARTGVPGPAPAPVRRTPDAPAALGADDGAAAAAKDEEGRSRSGKGTDPVTHAGEERLVDGRDQVRVVQQLDFDLLVYDFSQHKLLSF